MLDGSDDSYSERFTTIKVESPQSDYDPFQGEEKQSPQWTCAGIAWWQFDSRLHHTTIVVVPYWLVAVPLTLLSAYLILVPARKQPAIASPPHA
jgi:hypothetical protein